MTNLFQDQHCQEFQAERPPPTGRGLRGALPGPDGAVVIGGGEYGTFVRVGDDGLTWTVPTPATGCSAAMSRRC
jgi:hypothetical protein